MSDRNIFGSSPKVFGDVRDSSEIFGNYRKMIRNVHAAFGQIFEESSNMNDWMKTLLHGKNISYNKLRLSKFLVSVDTILV